MNEHLQVLDLAAREALPTQIDETTDPAYRLVYELVEAGYMSAIDASSYGGNVLLEPRITLEGREYLKQLVAERETADLELISKIEQIKTILASVSTGGPRIKDVNPTYRQLYLHVDADLGKRGIANPIPFSDLWDWHGRWSNGDLPTYRSRREFLSSLFKPLLEHVRGKTSDGTLSKIEPTGWLRVDRAVGEIRRRLAEARTEEQFQTIGLLCREVLISLAQAVYDPEKHFPQDKTKPSETDAKRLLDAYIAAELAGSSHEAARRHAKAAYDLATDLQHRRTATFREAAMCAEATASIVNVIAIVSGHRDPT